MTKINNIQIKNVSNGKKQGQQAPWGNLFGYILKAICKKYSSLNNIQNKATKLSEDFSKFLEEIKFEVYELKKIDPITLICFLTSNKATRKVRIETFLSIFKINVNNIILNNLMGIPSRNLFTMAKKYKEKYPTDELWELALDISKGRLKGQKIKALFNKIILENTGVKVTNLSAMMYLFNPKKYYCIDKKGAKKLLEIINEDEEIYSILKRISSDIDGSYGWDEFSNIQKLCRDNKNIIRTPYEFYFNLH